MAQDWRHQLGRRGEEEACRFLRARGYRILERNVRFPWGEIDFVARHGDDLVFGEVKSRCSTDYGRPSEAVNRAKQRQLSRLAVAYLSTRRLGEVNCRFDVVEVTFSPRGKVQHIEVIEDAFEYLE
ncbi:MAG TPA: YraN family protein [Armatimonadetes bacterium]|nr:YraN family protein [Armatimonadota bacterium]